MKISELQAKLEELKQKYGDIPVFCEESQDNYYEHNLVGKDGVRYQNDGYNEEGIYLSSQE